MFDDSAATDCLESSSLKNHLLLSCIPSTVGPWCASCLSQPHSAPQPAHTPLTPCTSTNQRAMSSRREVEPSTPQASPWSGALGISSPMCGRILRALPSALALPRCGKASVGLQISEGLPSGSAAATTRVLLSEYLGRTVRFASPRATSLGLLCKTPAGGMGEALRAWD